MAAWKVVKLSEVCEIQRGGSPRPIENFITEADDGINWIKIGDVAEGAKYITSTKEKIMPEGAQRSRAVQEGDFLLSNSMSFGRPYILRTSGCIHDGWLVLRYDKNQLTEDYLYHVLGSDFVYAQFEKFAVGAVVKNLNSEVVRQVSIPLPPLDEQRRIAAILDQADALRVKRREALAQLDSLTQSIFIEMFGDPVTNPKGWSCKPLGSVVKTTSGGTPDRSAYGYYDGDIPWVKSGELHHRLVTETEERITELGLKNSSAKLMPPGTVLVAMYGATVGAVSELGIHAATNQAICCMQPSEILLPCYLIAFMKQYTPTLLMRRVGGAQPNLSQDLLRNIQLPLAPINIQNQFKERLESTDYLVACHQRSKQQLDSLFASLQHRAFRGEI